MMEMMITKQSKEVCSALFNALDKLVSNRIKDEAFTDQEDVTTKSYFSTLEGLEALLVPFVNLPQNIFWEPLKNKHKELINAISNDLNFILNFNSKQDVPPKEQGIPYFEQGKGVRKTPYWTSECASFTLSVLTNFLLLRQKVGLPEKPLDQTIIEVIKSNLEWIRLCKRDNGWSWTNDSPSHPWPTWSLLDTFDEMINCDLIKSLHKEITHEFEPILHKIEESFKTDVVGSYLNDWEERVIINKPYDMETVMDLSRLMLAISLHSNRKTVRPLAYKLFSWASETNFANVDYNYYLKVKKDTIADSSFVPCVLRTLLLMAGMLRFKGKDELEKHIGQSHEVVLNRVYQHLMKNQINHGKFKGLWGVSDEGLKYELYFTERTIEALTEFIVHYGCEEFVPPSNVQPIKSNEPSFEKVTSKETHIIPAYLPILDEFARKVKKNKGNEVFNDAIIIYVLHFLGDLIPFVEKYNQLGCSYEDMHFLVKTYDYPEKSTLIEYFQSKGCNVVVPTDYDEKTFIDSASKILSQSIQNSIDTNKRILIVEDGGYFTPLFHKGEFVNEAGRCCGAVEQTTKGHRRDSKINSFQFPVISIANSKLKMFLEAQEVAETLQENIISTLRKYNADKPINKHKALILGFGTIGSKLAEALFNKNISISIYDSDPMKRMQAEVNQKFKVIEDLKDLRGFHIIIGTSGETALTDGKDFWNLEHNVILASGSSERLEFDLEALDEISLKVTRSQIFTIYTLKKDNKIIRLMCDGEPINFSLSEGISDSVIDPIYTEMFLASIEIMTNKDLKKELQEVSNHIENDVYDLFKTYHKS